MQKLYLTNKIKCGIIENVKMMVLRSQRRFGVRVRI
nr:MAG TPA: hypothetical protein [Caudoviricetes sp.]